MENEKEQLKQRVLEFVKTQKGYNKKEHEKLKAFCEDKKTYAVIYGEDLQSGIGGYGDTAELAFEDFVRSWNQFNGFEWINENKKMLHIGAIRNKMPPSIIKIANDVSLL